MIKNSIIRINSAVGNVLDGSGNDVYRHEWNGGDYQQWVFELQSGDFYKIRHIIDNKVLDGNGSKVYLHDWNGGDYQLWELVSQPGGRVAFKQKATGKFLDAGSNNVYLNDWNGGDYQLWETAYFNVLLEVEMIDLTYDDPKEPKDTYPLAVLAHLLIENDTAATVEKTVEHSETKSSTFSWSFTETLAVGLTTTFKAAIPLIGGAESELSLSLTLEANQTMTREIDEEYRISTTVSIPANSSVIVDGWFDWSDNVAFNFTTINIVSATMLMTDGIRKLSAVSEDKEVKSELEELLSEREFSGDVIMAKDDFQLQVSVAGQFKGSYGMNEVVEVKPAAGN